MTATTDAARLEWRIIRNTRGIGPKWRLQRGYWQQPRTSGYAKGLNSLFKVDYEELHATRIDAALALAERILHG